MIHQTAGAEFVPRVVKTDTKDLHPAQGGPEDFLLFFSFHVKVPDFPSIVHSYDLWPFTFH